jgi:hypothetical protein
LQDILPEAVVAELNNAQIEVKIQQLIQADSGGIFLQLLSRVGQVLQQQGLLIQNMRFSGQTLQLEMILPPVTQQQTVLAALKAQNLQIQTTTQAMVWKLQMQLQR